MEMFKRAGVRVMDGETVYVAVRSQPAVDRFGNEAPTWAEPVAVEHVLVGKATDEDMQTSRPDGIKVTATLTFPRTCELDLRGAKVTVGGRELLVAGEPAHEPSPLAWDMTVKAGVSDG